METSEENLSKENVEDAPTPPNVLPVKQQIPEMLPKKSKKEERSKKEDKSVELFLKSLNSIQSPEERFAALVKKYSETAEENRKLHSIVKQSDKRFAIISKEKEQIQLEYNRTVLVKLKLENLCRELQKQNKAIKDESLLKIHEEEERRKETQAKFQSTLAEITSLLQQNNDKNAKLRDDNLSMSKRFKSVVEQYELREQQVDKMAKQMALENQLADAKLAKANLEARAEKERLLAEMAHLKLELGQCHDKIAELHGTEAALKGQIGVYMDKYDEFQDALVKSNKVFGGFKGEMDKMSKKIVKLEKESLGWKQRWETSQSALLNMCGDMQHADERAAASERHLAQMQRLCRTMQAERTILLNTLKEHNIERPPLPAPPPLAAPAPAPAPPSKVDAMAANCAQLKQSLAQLQDQLNVLTNKKGEDEQQTKAKKGKGKKSKDKERTPTLSAAEPKNLTDTAIQIEKAIQSTVPQCSSSSSHEIESNDALDKTEPINCAAKVDGESVNKNLDSIKNTSQVDVTPTEIVENNAIAVEQYITNMEANIKVNTDEKEMINADNTNASKEVLNNSTAEINDLGDNLSDAKVLEKNSINLAKNAETINSNYEEIKSSPSAIVISDALNDTSHDSTVEVKNHDANKIDVKTTKSIKNDEKLTKNAENTLSTETTSNGLETTSQIDNSQETDKNHNLDVSLIVDPTSNEEIPQILENKSILETSQDISLSS